MTSTSWHALDSKQIHEELHDDSDSFSDISEDSDISIIEYSDPDDGLASANVRKIIVGKMNNQLNVAN